MRRLHLQLSKIPLQQMETFFDSTPFYMILCGIVLQ